ncbi:hypothetical protein ACIRQF_01855 [Streptomyces sp. NPDC101191]|uniref:hypothetical protein n=1 Tax=Streptomyces sp. NPDC101191 TaxID=3366126 RepID=UPI0037F84F5E
MRPPPDVGGEGDVGGGSARSTGGRQPVTLDAAGLGIPVTLDAVGRDIPVTLDAAGRDIPVTLDAVGAAPA